MARGGKREGAGRPREEATVLVPIRTTKHTREELKRLAAARGVSVGEYLLRLALDKDFPKDADLAPE